MDFAETATLNKVSAWLDMDALDHNIDLVNHKTQAVNLRIATKSIRSIEVLRYIKQRTPNYIGLMTYSAAESVYLLQKGFDNILCAYPTLDMSSVAETLNFTTKGASMIWMVDKIEHLRALNKVAESNNSRIKVCLDINMSMPLAKIYFGSKRSSLMYKKDVKQLLKQIKHLENIEISAVMGYEAQIAGLPEVLPNKKMLAPVIRLLKKQSQKQLSRRRKQIVNWLIAQGHNLAIVNGGGSGSIDFTCQQDEITEITVGSAYFKSAYFDYMDSMHEFKAAAGFVLPVTRQPEKNIVTCQGGGFIASGALGIDKLPSIVYPSGLSILKDEGFGEVQTPLAIDSKHDNIKQLNIGDNVWCRHAKAGELCEHFNELICYRNSTQIMAEGSALTMMTYRGEGKCFH